MKKALYLGSVLVLAWALYFFTIGDYRETDEFSLANVRPRHSYDPKWDVHPISSAEESNIHSILNQKFKYSGCGHQIHVFYSQDNKYVLKLVKQYLYNVPRWVRYLVPPFLSYRIHKMNSRMHKLDRDFTSYQIAFDRLKEETALKFVHLNHKDNFHHIVTLIDNSGVEHRVDLHDYVFVLQDVAVLVCPTLEDHMARGDITGAKAAIDSLLELLYARCKMKIHDSHPNFKKNFAFLNNRAIEIDVGRFSPKVPEKFPVIVDSFKTYLHEKFPELEKHFDDQYQAYIEKYSATGLF